MKKLGMKVLSKTTTLTSQLKPLIDDPMMAKISKDINKKAQESRRRQQKTNPMGV